MITPATVSHDRPSDSASRAERLVAAEDAFTRGDFVGAEASTQAMLADDPTDGRALLIAGAIALGLAENRMYWSASSSQCRDYLDALIATGWTPDEWTAATLTDRTDRD